MDNIRIGKYIQQQRKSIGLTQQQLADRLNISFQAVSKWENGDTTPDVSILLPLAEVLNTTTDKILNGGVFILKRKKLINVNEIVSAFDCFEELREVLGDTLYYKGMIEGINNKMNMDFENELKDKNNKEAHYAEAIIQLIMEGYSVNIDDVKNIISNEKMIDIIDKYHTKNK